MGGEDKKTGDERIKEKIEEEDDEEQEEEQEEEEEEEDGRREERRDVGVLEAWGRTHSVCSTAVTRSNNTLCLCAYSSNRATLRRWARGHVHTGVGGCMCVCMCM